MRWRMTWVRSNIKCLSRIALFALLVQFAASFGHFHALASAATSAPKVGTALTGSLTAQVGGAQSTRQPASNHDSDEHSGGICAVCAVVAMANAALFATPPALPLQQVIEFSHSAIEVEFADVASASLAFQPRAPPIS